jgi:hypothetical protein
MAWCCFYNSAMTFGAMLRVHFWDSFPPGPNVKFFWTMQNLYGCRRLTDSHRRVGLSAHALPRHHHSLTGSPTPTTSLAPDARAAAMAGSRWWGSGHRSSRHPPPRSRSPQPPTKELRAAAGSLGTQPWPTAVRARAVWTGASLPRAIPCAAPAHQSLPTPSPRLVFHLLIFHVATYVPLCFTVL